MYVNETREEALAESIRVIAILDSVAEEDWVAESFIPEDLVFESGDTWHVNVGQIFYELRESGLHQTARDFEKAIEASY